MLKITDILDSMCDVCYTVEWLTIKESLKESLFLWVADTLEDTAVISFRLHIIQLMLDVMGDYR